MGGGQEAEGGPGELTQLEWEEIDEGWGEAKGRAGLEGAATAGRGQASGGPSKEVGTPVKATVPRGKSYTATPQEIRVLESQWEALKSLQTGGGGTVPYGGEEMGEKEWTDWIKHDWPEKSAFKAGGPHTRMPIWVRLLELAGTIKGKQEQLVLKVLDLGLKLGFGPVDHNVSAGGRPGQAKRLAAVRRMMWREGYDPEVLLARDKPAYMHFRNHSSCETPEGAAIVRKTIEKDLISGALRECEGGRRPTVVCGLIVLIRKGVAGEPDKVRLLSDPRPVNIYSGHQSVSYEGLKDVAGLAWPGDWVFASDDTDGFHHWRVHEDYIQYLGLEFEGRCYEYTHVPFGIALGPWFYQLSKMVAYKAMRTLGLRLYFMMDDHLQFGQGFESTKRQSAAVFRILGPGQGGLGYSLSRSKSKPYPARRQLSLGLIVDVEAQAFFVPEPKVEMLRREVEELVSQETCTNRQVARVAGRLMALSLAVKLSPLLARAIGKARMTGAGWDDLWVSQQAMKADLEMAVEVLQLRRGRSWVTVVQEPTLTLVTDASVHSLAGFAVGDAIKVPVVIYLTEEQMQQVQDSDKAMSSTARELMASTLVFELYSNEYRHLFQGQVVMLETDSMSSYWSIMGMKGNPHTWPWVKRLVLAAANLDCELKVQWKRRDEPNQERADELSKMVDETEWMLHPEVYAELRWRLQKRWGCPTIDVFASSYTTKEGAYYSQYLDDHTKGVDAFDQPWAHEKGTGRRHLAFINPPFAQMGRVLAKVRRERVDCLIIIPRWPKPWAGLMVSMPVEALWDLPHRPDLFRAGPRNPIQGVRGPNYLIQAAVIIWRKS